MAIGPLESFIFPSVIVKTNLEAAGVQAAGDLRFPAIIGTSAEEQRVSDFEMVRGSSATADNIILDEDVNSPTVQLDGTNKNFTVQHIPIVTGDGSGSAATSPQSVIVTVNNESVAVNSVNGLTGEVVLVQIPAADSDVRVNYYFKRRDTYVENEDLSNQADGSNTSFKVDNQRIVKGDNGGTSATDDDIGQTVTILYDPDPNNPGDEYERTVLVIDCKVNGSSATISTVDGANGIFTLATAPSVGDTVEITYFTSLWQDTYDILPAPVVTRVVKVGLSQDTNDFSIGNDCVLANDNQLHWGHTYTQEQGIYTAGSDPLDDYVVASLADTRSYGRVASPVSPALSGGVPVVDANGWEINDGTNKDFELPTNPVDGTGLAVPTEDPSAITAYVGATWAAAKAAGSVTVTKIDGNVISLAVAPMNTGTPATSEKVFVTYYENLLVDDTWTITNEVAGGTGVGKYSISSTLHGWGLKATLKGLAEGTTITPVYEGAGAFNVEVNPLKAQVERVTITFDDGSGNFTVTSKVGPAFTTNGKTGSVTTYNQNKGTTGKTYVDPTTGFRFTFAQAPAFNPIIGNAVVYDVGDPTTTTSPDKYYITTDTNNVKVIPGLNLAVSSTDGGAEDNTDDTVLINTYNKTGDEPDVGDNYYVTFDRTKTNYNISYHTNMRTVQALYGPIDVNNRVVLAANLAFLNGSRAVAIKQVQKTAGGTDASVQDYIDGIDAFNEPLPNGLRPSLIEPLSTEAEVHSYLKTSNAIQSSIRYRNERTSIIGFAIGTSSDSVIQQCKNLATEKVTAVYPDGAIVGITDAYGNEVEYVVDGSLVASAVAGRDVSPVADIATPLTNSTIVGFKRLYQRADNVTASLVANAGCTVLEEQIPVIRILMYLTTDMSSSLTRDPRIVEVKHYVQQGLRRTLDRYIGVKNLPKIQPQVKDSVGGYFKALKKSEIITDYTGINVRQNETDPSTLDVEAYYSPVFPLNWILVTLNLRTSL